VSRLGGGLMVCGTTSDAGKSTVVAGLCRALARRGVRVAPFKGQNMALNSFVTADGHEIGRSTANQAMAAGVAPEVAMNPVLLKPTDDRTSQVMVMGRPWGVVGAADYHRAKAQLFDTVLDSLADLRRRFDVVICEGAGSPAEINLASRDITNLRVAAAAGLPAVIVGDIERGGVFAALYGTVALLPPDQRALVRGFVINRFRGDPALLGDGPAELARRCGVPTLGVLPWVPGIGIDAEDSLALSATRPHAAPAHARPGPALAAHAHAAHAHAAHAHAAPAHAAPAHACPAPAPARPAHLDVAVVALPRIANFTDVDAVALEVGVTVRLVSDPVALGHPDLIVLPGSKSTVADLGWLRRTGLAAAIVGSAARDEVTVLGICAGYQMLGTAITDGVEDRHTSTVPGLGLLPTTTVFAEDKVTRQRRGRAMGAAVHGYQIHHGRTAPAAPWLWLDDGTAGHIEPEGATAAGGRIAGTSLHGLFEGDAFRAAFLESVAARAGKGWHPAGSSFAAHRSAQADRLADLIERHLDTEAIDALIGLGAPSPRNH